MVYKTTILFKTEEEKNNFKVNFEKRREELTSKPIELEVL